VNKIKIMGLLTRLRGERLYYSSTPAPTNGADSLSLDATAAPQIARRPGGARLHRAVVYARRTLPSGRERVLTMDVHVPAGPGRKPLVVYVPGGGFAVSLKRLAAQQRAYLAAAGYVVASIEYRTVPNDATYVDGVADVKSAVRFLRSRADDYAVDVDHVALWGESAGGYLAAMAGLTAGRAEFETPDHAGYSSEVQAVIDQFGPSDLSRVAEGYDASTVAAYGRPDNTFAYYVNGRRSGKALGDDPATLAAANPITYVSPSAPPFLLLHGEDDRIISPIQTGLLHRSLRDAGVESTRYLLPGAGHGDLSMTGRQAAVWTTTTVMTVVRGFLDDHLRSRRPTPER
jgi:acetyl esterase/lipase